MRGTALEPARDCYSDRARPAAETIALVSPALRDLGVTRVARQTGLDRIGIPVFAAMRPNALTLAVNTGKGITDEAARASAVMEAVEYAVAEIPSVPAVLAAPAAVQAEGKAVFDVGRLLPAGINLDPDDQIQWLEGRDIVSGTSVLVPKEAVTIDSTRPGLRAIARSTNGLASGNSHQEAEFHALCELVERDAYALSRFRSDRVVMRSCVDPSAFRDPVVDSLARQIGDAGLQLKIFDITTDLGIPVYKAIIADATRAPALAFDVSAGTGCHPVPARAAIRAITEAAQTRITTISAARDDFPPAAYSEPFNPKLAVYRYAVPSRSPTPGLKAGLPLGASLQDAFNYLLQRLEQGSIRSTVSVPLGGEAFGVAVVKVLSADLEDSTANQNWRPGRRALRAMVGSI